MLKVVLHSKQNIVVPKQYNYGLHQFIFENLSPSMIQRYYHNGFNVGKRTYKLFTFSYMYGSSRLVGDYFEFQEGVTIFFNAYEREFLENFANHLLLKEEVHFLGNAVHVEGVEFVNGDIIESGHYLAHTLSPVVARRTRMNEAGKWVSDFYSPFDDEFPDLIRNNLYRKLRSVHSPICEELSIDDIDANIFDIEAVECEEKPKFVGYQTKNPNKRFLVKGYRGVFLLSGRKEFIEMAVKSGIGEKNPSGLGMLSYQVL